MKIQKTHSFAGRLRGLLGTDADGLSYDALCIENCRSVHTIGMRYPLDLAYLDRRCRVIRIRRRVAPGRICPGPAGTVSVLERPSSVAPWFTPGDVVKEER
jgi:hypothetical protein